MSATTWALLVVLGALCAVAVLAYGLLQRVAEEERQFSEDNDMGHW